MIAINAAAIIRRRRDSEPVDYIRMRCVAANSARLAVVSQGKTDPYEEVSNRGKTSAENLKVQR